MNSMHTNNQESIIIKSKAVIKSFDVYNEFLILGTEKGGCEIFNWKSEKQINSFNFYYKKNTKNDFFKFLKQKELSENCLQIINIGIINSLSLKSNSNKVYFYAQSRKGDFFICCFFFEHFEKNNKSLKSENSNLEFLYKIESNVESFCKFVFCEFKNSNEKINKGDDLFSVFLPSEKENILNVFSLEIVENKSLNNQKELDIFIPAKLESEAFDLVNNTFIDEAGKSRNIEKLLENKEKLISDFEAAACNNEQESIEDPIKFYSENGLISCMEKTDDQKLLVLGTENLSILVLSINSENKPNKNQKPLINLKIVDNLSLANVKKPNNSNIENTEINSILALKTISKHEKNILTILVGMYSSKIEILNFNTKTNKLEFTCEIKNACSFQKPGISSFDFIQFQAKIKNELDEMEFGLLEIEEENNLTNFNSDNVSRTFISNKINFLCTGAYDCKVRLYEFKEDKSDLFEYLGALSNGESSIIHKVKFVLEKGKEEEKENQEELFLFVASDQKILNVYNVA